MRKGYTLIVMPYFETVEGEEIEFYRVTNYDTGAVLDRLSPESLGEIEFLVKEKV